MARRQLNLRERPIDPLDGVWNVENVRGDTRDLQVDEREIRRSAIAQSTVSGPFILDGGDALPEVRDDAWDIDFGEIQSKWDSQDETVHSFFPNTTDCGAYQGYESSANNPITGRTFAGVDTALSSTMNGFLSNDDNNHDEVSNTGTPVCCGHRVDFDIGSITPTLFQVNVKGYGYEADSPTYGWYLYIWKYAAPTGYIFLDSHTHTGKQGLYKEVSSSLTDYVSGSDIVSILMQAEPWSGGGSAQTVSRLYYARLGVHV
jgi:hypothetical protein